MLRIRNPAFYACRRGRIVFGYTYTEQFRNIFNVLKCIDTSPLPLKINFRKQFKLLS